MTTTSRRSAEPTSRSVLLVIQQSAVARVGEESRRTGQYAIGKRVPEPLMIPFEMVVRDVFSDRPRKWRSERINHVEGDRVTLLTIEPTDQAASHIWRADMSRTARIYVTRPRTAMIACRRSSCWTVRKNHCHDLAGTQPSDANEVQMVSERPQYASQWATS